MSRRAGTRNSGSGRGQAITQSGQDESGSVGDRRNNWSKRLNRCSAGTGDESAWPTKLKFDWPRLQPAGSWAPDAAGGKALSKTCPLSQRLLHSVRVGLPHSILRRVNSLFRLSCTARHRWSVSGWNSVERCDRSFDRRADRRRPTIVSIPPCLLVPGLFAPDLPRAGTGFAR